MKENIVPSLARPARTDFHRVDHGSWSGDDRGAAARGDVGSGLIVLTSADS
jgi:hypothetical protein